MGILLQLKKENIIMIYKQYHYKLKIKKDKII